MSFKSQTGEFMIKLQRMHDENIAKVEDALYNEIVDNSPVQSGAYRANHNRTADVPDYFFDETRTAAESPPPELPASKVLYIANGAPYAKKIEDGYPHGQKPDGVYGVSYNSVKARFGL